MPRGNRGDDGPHASSLATRRSGGRQCGAAARRARALPACLVIPSPHALEALQQRHGPNYRWWLLLTVMIGTMASIMSSTIVNVAVPDMSQHFTLGQERAQWVSSGFMVAMTVSMLTTPWLLARFGYRRTYVGTMLLLMAGGIGGGLRQQLRAGAGARVAEGLAAGMVQPIPAIIILRAFEPHEQGRASGMFGMGVVLAPAVGPSIGGVLVDLFGWRSIFFMVVPFCLASLWLARQLRAGDRARRRRGQCAASRLDWRGLAARHRGHLCLLNGLVRTARRQPPQAAAAARRRAAAPSAPSSPGSAGGARRRAADEPGAVRLPQFAMGSVVAFIYGTALFGSTYLLPVYMQIGLELPPSHVGTDAAAGRARAGGDDRRSPAGWRTACRPTAGEHRPGAAGRCRSR